MRKGETVDSPALFEVNKRPSYGQALWTRARQMTRSEAMHMAEEYSKSSGFFALTIIPRFSAESPCDLYRDLGRRFLHVDVRRSAKENNLCVLRLADAKRDLAGVVAIVPGRFEGVWLVMTDMKRSGHEYRHLVEPVLQLMQNRAPGAWLRTADLKQVLFSVEDRLQLPLTPDRVSSRNRERSSVEYMKKRRSIADVFDELAKRELVLRSLDFTAVGEGSRVALKAGVDKWMRLKFKGGSYLPFDKLLVASVEAKVQQHVRALNVPRERALQSPIVFRFTHDVLTNRVRHEELVGALSSLRGVSVCTFHMNPYLHVSLVDYSDGSNMDLFSDDPSTLAVIPGKRCSVGAISRTFNQVYGHFASGEIANLEHASVQA
jgi:hypothetical protein